MSLPSSRCLSPIAVAAILVMLTALPARQAQAVTRTVGNCNDHGAGSLRSAVAGAPSGATIDLRSLACNRIRLTSGQIGIAQDDLTLLGRSRDALTIDGNLQDRVIQHTGAGTLRLRGVSIANGYLANPEPWSGCIHSAGSVELLEASLHHCSVVGRGGLEQWGSAGDVFASGRVLLSFTTAFANRASPGSGGAVRGGDKVVLDHSQVYGNHAEEGGGVYGGSVVVSYSVIRGNDASHGGGIAINCGHQPPSCDLTVRNSTISGNIAVYGGGGFDVGGAYGALITDSTLTGNVADSISAGWLPGKNARIFNSTIAFNDEQPRGAGAECHGAIASPGVTRIVSSIVAGNTCSVGQGHDIFGTPEYGARIIGTRNIIGGSDLAVPVDTISADPRLGPLANNGGPTRTLRPLAGSPALDRGSNPLDCRYDQRGPGYPRVRGPLPDIGAIER